MGFNRKFPVSGPDVQGARQSGGILHSGIDQPRRSGPAAQALLDAQSPQAPSSGMVMEPAAPADDIETAGALDDVGEVSSVVVEVDLEAPAPEPVKAPAKKAPAKKAPAKKAPTKK